MANPLPIPPVYARRTAGSPNHGGANALGINQVRRVFHTLAIGDVMLPQFSSFAKDESPYNAGSSLTVTLRSDVNADLMALTQTVIPLSVVVKTRIEVDGYQVMLSTDEEFSGVLMSIEDDYDTSITNIVASSYAQILQNEPINKVFSSPAEQHKTTTEVVKEVVAEFGKGLKCVADDFSTKVGGLFKDKNVRVSTNIKVWDLIQNFAQSDGADCYVKGDTLYYVKKVDVVTPDITQLKNAPASYEYRWGYNIKSLKIKHQPMFAHDINVTVTTYNPRSHVNYEARKNAPAAKLAALAKQLEIDPNLLDQMQTAAAEQYRTKRKQGKVTATVTAARIGNKENYAFYIPGITQEDCDRLASLIQQDIARKEFLVTLRVLGQPDFNPRQYIKLSGTRSSVTDQVYAIKNIHTESNVSDTGESSGYETTFTLVNHAVQTSGTNLGLG